MPNRSCFVLLIIVLLGGLITSPTNQPLQAAPKPASATLTAAEQAPLYQTKETALAQTVGPMLAALHTEYQQHQAQVEQGIALASDFTPDDPLLQMVDDRVIIDVVVEQGMNIELLQRGLERLGMQQTAHAGGLVSGQLPVDALALLPTLENVRFAQPAYAATNAGSVTSQGDVAMLSNQARSSLGIDGANVSIGTLSDSYGCLSASPNVFDDVASGDLPGDVVVLQDYFQSDCSDEGRAMMQLIHDVAPGSRQLFHTAFGGQAVFADGIRALANAGATVIVDDIIYFAEPMFQDGIIAQAVDEVVANGAAYFSSAGNGGRNAYESSFQQTVISTPPALVQVGFDEGNLVVHDFDPGPGVDPYQQMTIPPRSQLVLTLQWDQPFASVSSASPGSANDLDAVVLDETLTTIVNARSGNFFTGLTNNLGNDAVEILRFTNTSFTQSRTINLLLPLFDGPVPNYVKYVTFGFQGTFDEYATNSPTLYGHANAEGASAVGAAFYVETPPFGVSPPLLESFSSPGPTPIFFGVAGNALGQPIIRAKPDIVAPDGTNTTFFGSSDPEDDGFPNFFGTSAAAPHAAAVAALILDLANGDLTPAQVYAAMEETAVDMDSPGFDNNTGAGLVNADAALGMLAYNVQTLPNASTRFTDPGKVVTHYLQITNSGLFADTFNLSVSSGTYPTALSNNTVVVGSGQQATVTVAVTLPANALPGERDTVMATVTSQTNPEARFEIMITTGIGTSTFTPIVVR